MADLIRVDRDAQQAWQGSKLLSLTSMEFKLLVFLTERAGQVVSMKQILAGVWRTEWMGLRKSLTTTLVRLRRELGDDAQHPIYITTIRYEGWRFEASMVTPSETRTVDIDGRRYDVLHWEKHPFQGSTATFTLHAREVMPDGRR
ncbi:winged helix-turn-helix domain-containing protein [Nonomuraea sp. NPDC050643]|uniref:winged helix-turn-helix domain-containing protein n=1 Tax=Nonomuraea sp. NPDC050643 TaxID=3155660 RepID=UPI0033D25B3F